jgi:hypothetical protein
MATIKLTNVKLHLEGGMIIEAAEAILEQNENQLAERPKIPFHVLNQMEADRYQAKKELSEKKEIASQPAQKVARVKRIKAEPTPSKAKVKNMSGPRGDMRANALKSQGQILDFLRKNGESNAKDIFEHLKGLGYDNNYQVFNNRLWIMKNKGEIINPKQGFYDMVVRPKKVMDKPVINETPKKKAIADDELVTSMEKEDDVEYYDPKKDAAFFQ